MDQTNTADAIKKIPTALKNLGLEGQQARFVQNYVENLIILIERNRSPLIKLKRLYDLLRAKGRTQ